MTADPAQGAQAPFFIPERATDKNRLRQLIEQWAPTRQRHRLLQQLKRLPEKGVPRFFSAAVKPALEQTLHRAAIVPQKLDFDPNLPVNQRREEMLELINNHQVVVIAGETGSGKTTQIPKICLQAGLGMRGLIGCTQPRRLAARSVAQRLAEEVGSPLGKVVGYQVRFHDQVRDDSLIKVMTDGILLAEIQNDRFLSRYEAIIIDEAHERSLNIDFLLGYLKQLLPKRPDLKVIITSATIDTEAFSRHFDSAPIIEVSGRTYPVEVRYRPLEAVEDDAGNRFEPTLTDGILDALDELAAIDPYGDVLVFLVGERDIKETAEAIRKRGLKNTEVLPLYARQPLSEQQKIFQPNPHKRRIILATNVAETSLTVPGIKFVIDTGLVRISRYSPRLKVLRLPIEKISQASANQRKGRCGRVSEGVCIRLYSEEDFLARPRYTDPEIKRTALASAILQMKQLGLGEIERFPFIDPPEPKMVRDGEKALHEIGALDAQGRLTALGRQVARLPVDPHFARMILEGQRNNVLTEVLIVVSALSIQDPREINEQNQAAARTAHAKWNDPRSDFLFFVHLWHFYEYQKRHLSQNKLRKLCRTNFLSFLRMREWHDLFMQLRATLKQMGIAVPDPHPLEVCEGQGELTAQLSELHTLNLHKSILSGLLGNIGMRDDEYTYVGARNSRFYIHPSSVLFKHKPKWLVSAELVETTKLWARTNAPIDVRWIEPLAQHLIKRSWQDPHWEAKRGQVGAYENVTLYGLPLVNRRKVNYGRINPMEAHKIFLQALAAGQVRTRVPAIVHNEKLKRRIRRLEHKIRRPDLLVEEAVLYDFYARLIPESVYSQPAFEKWYRSLDKAVQQKLFLRQEDLLKRQPETDWERDFPDQVVIDNRLPLQVRYRFAPGEARDGVTFRIPIEALSWLEESRFDFLTPGLLPEKVVAYLKALPGGLRKRLVPVPQSARQIAARMDPDSGEGFRVQLRRGIQRILGEEIDDKLFENISLPDYLKPKFEVVDRQGKVIAQGEKLADLRQTLKAKLERAVQQQAGESPLWQQFEQDLPVVSERKVGRQTFVVYPALQATPEGVRQVELSQRQEAEAVHAEGVLALLRYQLRDQYNYLMKKLPLQRACLIYAPFGSCESLTNQLIMRALRACVPDYAQIRTVAAFTAALAQARQCWIERAQHLAQQLNTLMRRYQQVRKRLKGGSPHWLESLQDMGRQLDELVFTDFVQQIPDPWFDRLPVYLQGLEKRLERLALNPQKDFDALRTIREAEALVTQARTRYGDTPAVQDLRWQLQELRLQLFAPGIKTLQPVSLKRIEKAVSALRQA
ncbi:MAG TPA: ATP-dependent RNA helicase HrpA [Piscirickettsiaceae bacterium]|nr:ATP-dependent RNA helicase HrpA [Piscirickettsiaceae bacterium]